jgi:hypothetical protein
MLQHPPPSCSLRYCASPPTLAKTAISPYPPRLDADSPLTDGQYTLMEPLPCRKTTSGKPRTRTAYACTNCRRSKVKCDEKRPVCARCQHRNLTCSGPMLPLKWVDDYLSLGKAFGRAGVWARGRGSRRPSLDTSFFAAIADMSEEKWVEVPNILHWNYVHCDTLSVTRMYERDQAPQERVLLPARDMKHLTYDEPFHPSETSHSDVKATTAVPQTLAAFPILKDLRTRSDAR